MLSTIIRTLPVMSLVLLGACPNEQAADIDTLETPSGSSGSSGSSGTTNEPVPTTGADLMPGTTTAEADTTGTDATTGGDDATTGPGSPICGNGIVEEDEECDDTFANNTLHGACLPGCVMARCGDGNVQAGVEECDLGDDVNEYKYFGC